MPQPFNRNPDRTVREGAEAARQAGQDVANLVHEKQLAYGDSSGLQFEFWRLVLRQYLAPANVEWGGPFDSLENQQLHGQLGAPGHPEHHVRYNPGGHYVLPVELLDHMPRLTRVMDRVFRILANPASDRMGEDTWMDLAGDAVCGMVMPRTQPPVPPQHGELSGASITINATGDHDAVRLLERIEAAVRELSAQHAPVRPAQRPTAAQLDEAARFEPTATGDELLGGLEARLAARPATQ